LEPPLLEGALAERRRGRPRRRPGLLAGDARRDRATAPVAAYLTDRRAPARLLGTPSGTRPGPASPPLDRRGAGGGGAWQAACKVASVRVRACIVTSVRCGTDAVAV